MNLKLGLWCSLLLLGAILMMFGSVDAAQLSFQPRIEAGVMYYAFESEEVSHTTVSEPVPANNGLNYTQEAFEYNDSLRFIGGGGTLFFRRFFLDISGQYADDGEDSETVGYSGYTIIEYDPDNLYMNTGYLAADPVYDVRFERIEMAVSLGYTLSKQSSIFLGYKWAKTQFDTTYQGPYGMVSYNSDGDIDGTSGGRVWGNAEFSFEYQGPFIGAIQGWEFRPCRFIQGVFSTSVALAYMQGKMTLDKRNGFVSVTWINGQEVPEVVRPVDMGGIVNRYDTEGESLGMTLGLAWRGLTAMDGLSYHISVSGYRYEFDAQENSQSDINETSIVYKLGLSYVF